MNLIKLYNSYEAVAARCNQTELEADAVHVAAARGGFAFALLLLEDDLAAAQEGGLYS